MKSSGIKLTIQEKLKDLRAERKMTLAQLSEATGLSRAVLGRYEADNLKDMSAYSVATLARFYGVSVDYILGLSERR